MAYTTATVNAWYQAVQFQPGPTATVTTWVNALNADQLTPAQVQNSIITQDVYTLSVVNPVLRLYQSSFNSVPDQAGQAYWVGQFGSGAQTYQQIANGFATSVQFTGIYGNTTATQIANQAQVTLLYQNILQRNPDAGGLAYWSTQPIGVALAGISSSPEMINVSSLPIQNFQAAEIAGTAAGSGSLYNYPGFPTTTYVLTTGIDAPGVGAFATSTGVSVGSNASVFGSINSGTATTYNPGDQITANAGTQNTSLTLSDGAVNSAPTDITSVAATVTNIPTVTVNSSQGILFNSVTGTNRFTGTTQLNINNAGADTITAAGTTGISINNTAQVAASIQVNGGNAVSVTSAGGTTGTIAVGATTAAAGNVTINSAQNIATTGGTIAVTGGKVISVTSTTSGNAVNTTATLGAISVTGNASTTSVTVRQSAGATAAAAIVATANTNNALAGVVGITNSAVTITDANAGSTTAAATIASVTLQNYLNSTISSNALTSLSLSSTGIASGTLGVTYGLATGNPTALALNLGGGSLGALTLGTNITTVNSTLTANTTLAAITNTGLRTLNIAGTGILNLTAVNTALTAITNTSTAAGFNGDVSSAAGLTSLNFSTTSANNTVTINAATQSYTGGSGVDTVSIGANALRAISGGTGTADVLVLTNTSATYTASSYTTNISGFETLLVANATGGTYSMANWTGFTTVGTALAGSTNTFSNVAANTALVIYKAAATTTTYTLAGTNGAASSVAITLAGTDVASGGTAGYTTTAITVADANGVGVGTVSINSDASVFQGLHTIITLTDNALSNLAITGTGSLRITNAATTSTSLTISDNGTGTSATADGITTLTSTGNVLGNISYSGTHAFTIGTLGNDVANLTIANANTGTTGVLTIGAHANGNTGAGSLTLTGSVAYTGTSASTGAFTVSAAGDSQNINWQASLVTNGGVKTVTTGSGNDVVLTGAAADIINVGTGTDLVRAGAGADQVTFGAGADTFQLETAAAAGGGESGTFLTPGTNTISTTTFDVYTGLKVSDVFSVGTTISAGIAAAPGTYNLAAAGAAVDATLNTAVTHLTDLSAALGGANTLTLIRGTYSSAANTFVGSTTGSDTLAVLDTDSDAATTAYEAVVLVGYADNSTATVAAAGLITL